MAYINIFSSSLLLTTIVAAVFSPANGCLFSLLNRSNVNWSIENTLRGTNKVYVTRYLCYLIFGDDPKPIKKSLSIIIHMFCKCLVFQLHSRLWWAIFGSTIFGCLWHSNCFSSMIFRVKPWPNIQKETACHRYRMFLATKTTVRLEFRKDLRIIWIFDTMYGHTRENRKKNKQWKNDVNRRFKMNEARSYQRSKSQSINSSVQRINRLFMTYGKTNDGH